MITPEPNPGRPWNRDILVSQQGHSIPETLVVDWQRSRSLTQALEFELREKIVETDRLTVIIAGSLGRMEFHQASDIDWFVIADNPQAADDAVQIMNQQIKAKGLRASQTGGSFGVAVALGELIDPCLLGKLDEEPSSYSRRLHLLLEGQPLLGEKYFQQCQRSVLQFYQQPLLVESPTDHPWAYLCHELARYYHSLWIRSAFPKDGPTPRSRRRMEKLYLSRRLTITSLFVSLAMQTERADIDGLVDIFQRTPFERLSLLAKDRTEEFMTVASHYAEGLNQQRRSEAIDARVSFLFGQAITRLARDLANPSLVNSSLATMF